MKHIRIDRAADGIATITLDHATESMNLVSPEWIAEFDGAVTELAADENVIGVIVTSAKPAFMAGADLKIMAAAFETIGVDEAFEMSRRANEMHRHIELAGKPFLAAINGLALGGGFELALACHYRFITDSPKAIVGLPEVTVGLLAGSGGTQRMPRMIGIHKALPLLLDGKTLSPAEALAIGLVDQVAPAGDLLAQARAFLLSKPSATRPWDEKGFVAPGSEGMLNASIAATFSMQMAALDAKHGRNYPAPLANLSAIFEGIQLPLDRALTVEGRYFAKLLTDPVARNIIRTSFVNKGAADKLVGRPQGIEKATYTKVGVLGAGMMGAGIAYSAASVGIEVVLLDVAQEVAEKGKAWSVKTLSKQVERGRMTQDQADAILKRITPTVNYAELAGCELVIEAVAEDTGIKADVTRKTAAVIGETAIFASNTSTLPITGLAEAWPDPERFIGLHFFSPVDRMALVEVIMGRNTSQATLAHSLDFVAQLRKTPIIVNDSRGFYTSRVFQTLIHEGAAMLGQGVAPALIENAAKQAGFPVGPLALLDEVTVDLPLKIVDQAIAEDGDRYTPPCGVPVMRRMKDDLKRPSRKAGGGFYEYPDGAPKRLWAGLKDAFPPATVQPDVEELKMRFLYIQALEAARCLEEGVLTTAADADIGSVLGWGFPTWTGGTLSLIDTVGIRQFVETCDRFANSHGARFEPSAWLKDRAARDESFYPSASDAMSLTA